MLKIGDFSKLSHLTVKALRFYEKEKLLIPVSVDEWTGYRFYETSQLEDAARIKACPSWIFRLRRSGRSCQVPT